MPGPSFVLFDFAVDPALPRQCCSGRHRAVMGRQGDLIILPADFAQPICDSMPGALRPITGRKLSAVKRAAGVSTLGELADLPHEILQAARSALKPRPVKG